MAVYLYLICERSDDNELEFAQYVNTPVEKSARQQRKPYNGLMAAYGELKSGFMSTKLLKRHDQFVAFYFYCKIMLISISYNYCSVLTANKCFIETELTL